MKYFSSVCSWYCYHHNVFIACHPLMWGCVEHTPDMTVPQGHGNGIQMLTIHEITGKRLTVCKQGLRWDQPWKAQLKEVLLRRDAGRRCLALKEQDRIPGTGSIVKVSNKGNKKGAAVETTPGSCQSSEQSLMGGAEWEQTRELRAVHLLPYSVYPGTDWKNMSCLVKGSGSTQHPSPG